MKSNKGAFIAVISTLGIVSAAAVAGFVFNGLKKNLIKNLNDSDFGQFKGYSFYSPNDDSYDEVLRHRKERYYQKLGMR